MGNSLRTSFGSNWVIEFSWFLWIENFILQVYSSRARIIAIAVFFFNMMLPACAPLSAQEAGPSLKPPIEETFVSSSIIRKDRATAEKVARYVWLDKMAQADPEIVASICAFPSAAKILARHRHLDKIALADHYTCRRLTQYRGVAKVLVANPRALRVVSLDPEGLYYAIKRDRSIAKRLTRNQYFDQMVVENPDLGRMLALYM